MYQRWNLKLDHRKMGHGKLTYNKQERFESLLECLNASRLEGL